GRLQLVSSNGTPIDTVYAELHDLMPSYFPNEIKNAAQQLAYMGEIARKSNLVETDIKKVYGEDYEVYTKNRVRDWGKLYYMQKFADKLNRDLQKQHPKKIAKLYQVVHKQSVS
ncbi:MAG: hypothetical protein RR716_04050, partial [Christensenellaceae bacterium]